MMRLNQEISNINQTESSLPLTLATLCIATAIFATLIWSAFTRMPEIARAEGQISTLNDLSRIDHFDGGVVEKVMVNPGEPVANGQLIAVIGQPGLTTELAVLEQQIRKLTRDRFRVRAVLSTIVSGAPEAQVGVAQEAAKDGDVDGALSAYIASQHELYRTRRQAITARIERLERAHEAAELLQTNAVARLELNTTQLQRGEDLFRRGLISRSEMSVRQDSIETVRADLLEAELRMIQSSDAVQEAHGTLVESDHVWREELLSTLYEIEAELDEFVTRKAELAKRQVRSEVRATTDGIVQNVFADAVGQVVPAGGTIVDVLNTDDELVAIVKLSPQDVGHVKIGDEVKIRPTTFDFRRYGDLTGRVTTMAPTSQMDEQNQPFFRTVVSLESQTIGADGDARALRAGMEVSADIVTSDRTVLAFFLKPLERVFKSSLSER